MPGVASVPVTRDRRARPAQKGYMRPPPRPKKMTASRKLANLKLRALQDPSNKALDKYREKSPRPRLPMSGLNYPSSAAGPPSNRGASPRRSLEEVPSKKKKSPRVKETRAETDDDDDDDDDDD